MTDKPALGSYALVQGEEWTFWMRVEDYAPVPTGRDGDTYVPGIVGEGISESTGSQDNPGATPGITGFTPLHGVEIQAPIAEIIDTRPAIE